VLGESGRGKRLAAGLLIGAVACGSSPAESIRAALQSHGIECKEYSTAGFQATPPLPPVKPVAEVFCATRKTGLRISTFSNVTDRNQWLQWISKDSRENLIYGPKWVIASLDRATIMQVQMAIGGTIK